MSLRYFWFQVRVQYVPNKYLGCSNESCLSELQLKKKSDVLFGCMFHFVHYFTCTNVKLFLPLTKLRMHVGTAKFGMVALCTHVCFFCWSLGCKHGSFMCVYVVKEVNSEGMGTKLVQACVFGKASTLDVCKRGFQKVSALIVNCNVEYCQFYIYVCSFYVLWGKYFCAPCVLRSSICIFLCTVIMCFTYVLNGIASLMDTCVPHLCC